MADYNLTVPWGEIDTIVASNAGTVNTNYRFKDNETFQLKGYPDNLYYTVWIDSTTGEMKHAITGEV
jgi:hypothetical protein